MTKPLMAAIGIGLLVGACSAQSRAPASSPPSLTQEPSFVFFDWDKSTLSPEAMATIRQAAVAYQAIGSVRFTNVGNTDTSGSTDYNMALSMRRADAVKRALVQNGVPAAAVESVGRGQTNLLVPTADGVREPNNRRVELGIRGQASTDSVTAPVIAIVKADALQEAAFREVVRNNFDLPYMERFALGTHWNGASEPQRARLLAALESAEVRAFRERLGKLAGFTQTIAKVVPRPSRVWIVHSVFSHASGPSIKVEWEVRDNGRGPRITDVRIEGVSMAMTRRSEFNSYILKHGSTVEPLVKELEVRVARQ